MTEDLLLRLEREDRAKAEHIRELRECAAETADDVDDDCDAEPRCGCHDPCCPCDGAKRGTP